MHPIESSPRSLSEEIQPTSAPTKPILIPRLSLAEIDKKSSVKSKREFRSIPNSPVHSTTQLAGARLRKTSKETKEFEASAARQDLSQRSLHSAHIKSVRSSEMLPEEIKSKTRAATVSSSPPQLPVKSSYSPPVYQEGTLKKNAKKADDLAIALQRTDQRERVHCAKVDPAQLVLKVLQNSLSGDPLQFVLIEDEDELAGYDKELRRHLARLTEQFRETRAFNLKENIYVFCTTEAVAYFEKLPLRASNEQIEDFSRRFFCLIRQPEILLGDSRANFEKLRAETWRCFKIHDSRTAWSTELYALVNHILNATDIIEVLHALESVAGKKKSESRAKSLLGSPRALQGLSALMQKDNLVKKLVFNCFGQMEPSDVLETLYGWNCDAEQKVLQGQLRGYIASIAKSVEKTRTLSCRVHKLQQEASICISSMGTIDLKDIARSLMPEKMALIDKILINGHIFYDALSSGCALSYLESGLQRMGQTVPAEENSAKKNQCAFYYDLFSAIAYALNKEIPPYALIIQKVNQFLLLVRKEEAPGFGQGKNLLRATFPGDIPEIGLLKLMTVNSFLAVHNYLRVLFPDMFTQGFDSSKTHPYELKYPQGNICAIQIDQVGSYSVTHQKKAFIYHVSNASTPVATLDLNWRIKPTETGWEGALNMTSWTIHDMSHWMPLVYIWTHPKKRFESAHVPAGYTYLPDA